MYKTILSLANMSLCFHFFFINQSHFFFMIECSYSLGIGKLSWHNFEHKIFSFAYAGIINIANCEPNEVASLWQIFLLYCNNSTLMLSSRDCLWDFLNESLSLLNTI